MNKLDIVKALHAMIRHLKEHGPWIFLGRIYMSGGLLLISIILTRLMSQEEFGQYRYVMTMTTIVAILSMPGVAEVVVRTIPRGQFSAYNYLFLFRLKVSITTIFAFLAFAFYSFEIAGAGMMISLFLIGLTLPLYFTGQINQYGYLAQMRIRDLNRLYVGRTTLQVLGVVGAYVISNSVFLSLACMIMLLTSYDLWKHRRIVMELSNKADEIPLDKRRLRRDSFMITISTALPILAVDLDKILVQDIVGFDQLGIYSIGLSFGVVLSAFFKPFIDSIAPKLVHHSPKIRHYLIVFLTGTAIGFIFALATPIVVPMLFGDAYTASAPLAVIVLLSMGLFFVKVLYFNYAKFNKDRKLGAFHIANITSAALIILYVIFVARFLTTSEIILFWMIGAYPLKLISEILILYLFSKFFSEAGTT